MVSYVNQTNLCTYMVATGSPTGIAFKEHILYDTVEQYFLQARWFWGGDLVRQMVFRETNLQ